MFEKTFKWLLSSLLAVLFLAAPAVFAKGRPGGQQSTAGSKAERQKNRRELNYQRRRIKQSGQRAKAETRQSGHHVKPPKVERHRMTHATSHNKPQNPNLRRARKQNRSHRTTHHPTHPN